MTLNHITVRDWMRPKAPSAPPDPLTPLVVGVIDDGFEGHPLTDGKVDWSISQDHADGDASSLVSSDSFHGQLVLGVLTGALPGMTKPAGNSIIAAHRVSFGADSSYDQFINALKAQVNSDVVNNSWGFAANYRDGWDNPLFRGFGEAIEHNAAFGRDGLGTTTVWAAGNGRMMGLSSNSSALTNNQFGIAVGALDSDGRAAWFSAPGASVLVSALGVDVLSSDRVGAAGYADGDTASVNGTSFAAPEVAKIIGRMYEANRDLGYRDVQEILALSARPTELSSVEWQTNGATNWNGGGMQFSHRHGFGQADGDAAVRLSESWTETSTYHDRVMVTVENDPLWGIRIPDNGRDRRFATMEFEVTEDIEIDRIDVDVDISHWLRGDLRVILESPTGTQSILADRPGKEPGNFWSGGDWSLFSGINWSFNTVAHWGESSVGTWKLIVQDWAFLYSGRIESASVTFIGDEATEDDTFYFTDAFEDFGVDGHVIDDATGTTRLNLAALSSDAIIDLEAGSGSISGKSVEISEATRVGRVDGGGGNDMLRGDTRANYLAGGWGDDILIGMGGSNILDGGAGLDLAVFDGDIADFQFSLIDIDRLHFTAFHLASGDVDTLWDIEELRFNDTVIQSVELLSEMAFV